MRRLTVTLAAAYLSMWAWRQLCAWAERQQAVLAAEGILREVEV